MDNQQNVALSRQSLFWLRHATHLFLTSPLGGRAKSWIGCLLFLMLCINAMNVANSYVLRDFMSAIEARNSAGFLRYAWIYCGVFVISTLVNILFQFAEARLGLLWRDWMTKRLTGLYVDGRIYLQLQSEQSVTNPDQRISEDIKSLTVTTLSFVLMILNSSVTAISFAGVLWAISPLLFLVSVVYAFVGSGLTILLGRPLIRLNYQQEDLEANFRADLIRIRQAADGIALAGYEKQMRSRLMERIDQLVKNFQRIIAVNRNLGFFTAGYNYMIQLIPALIVAPLFIRGDADFGVIGQSAMAFSTLVAAFSLIITQFQSISAYASVVTRLSEFAEEAHRISECTDRPCVDCCSVEDKFAFRNLTLLGDLEGSKTLIKNLNVTFEKGQRVLINGTGRAAKHALFRAAAGLPMLGSGNVDHPPPGKCVFISENPFLPTGTLHDVFGSTDRQSPITDAEIVAALREVGLESVLVKNDGLTLVRHWHDVLSLKEEQLMAVARAIIVRPDFAMLDQLKSALGEQTEQEILTLLARYGMTCISIGDESPDPEFHDACLELHEDGSWEWTDCVS